MALSTAHYNVAMPVAHLFFACSVLAQPAAGGPGTEPGDAPVVALALVASGASERAGRYFPSRVEMGDASPVFTASAPESLRERLVGTIPLDGGVAFAWGQGEDGVDTLIVDTNRNNDLRDDLRATRATSKYGPEKQFTRTDGEFTVNLGSPARACAVRWFRFDPADPARTAQARSIHYYRDYGREGTLTLAGKEHRVLLMDDRTTGSFDPTRTLVGLYLDRNGDGRFEARGEVYDASQAFNIGGKVYELRDVAPDGAALRVVESEQVVEEVHLAPDLRVGGVASGFTGATADARSVKFPEDYKGKLVLLDFWATWCQPCVAEMPTVVKAKKDFGARGFSVLGVSLDAENAEQKIASTSRRLEMDWPHVYDGGHWHARVAKQYQISSIPAAFLVDGDTGTIVAMGRDLRGENLGATVERELTARGR
jgi:thiol-disulfide isomerase/thioredoxin